MSRKVTRSVDAMLAGVEISDGRVSMEAGAREAASLYVRLPERKPLGRIEAHADLVIQGPEFEATVSLDADGRDALLEALQAGDGDD